MKLKKVDENFLCDYLKIDEPDLYEKQNVKMAFEAAKEYIKNQTGINDEVLYSKDDLTIAVLVLTEDVYENRRYYVDNANMNEVVKNIIYQYSENLL